MIGLKRMPWPRGYKIFFMLNSAEHEIFSANKYENANKLAFSYLLAEKITRSAMLSKKEFAIISNLRFISRTNFMLSWVEHEKSFITLGPDQTVQIRRLIWAFAVRICLKTSFCMARANKFSLYPAIAWQKATF